MRFFPCPSHRVSHVCVANDTNIVWRVQVRRKEANEKKSREGKGEKGGKWGNYASTQRSLLEPPPVMRRMDTMVP